MSISFFPLDRVAKAKQKRFPCCRRAICLMAMRSGHYLKVAKDFARKPNKLAAIFASHFLKCLKFWVRLFVAEDNLRVVNMPGLPSKRIGMIPAINHFAFFDAFCRYIFTATSFAFSVMASIAIRQGTLASWRNTPNTRLPR